MSTNTSAGHLSLGLEDTGRDGVPFSFDRKPGRLSLSVATSVAVDALILMLFVVASRYGRPTEAHPFDAPAKSLVWLAEPGPGGGGGGGGNRMNTPVRQVELPGKDTLTVPIETQPKLDQTPARAEPNPIEQLNIPAQSLAAAVESLPGALDAPAGPPTFSRGSGSGRGVGTGSGSGIGSGNGSGLGPGSDGGTGGEVFGPGNGVTDPVKLFEVRPAYTSDAMRAHLQGSVLLECVVRPDGSVGDIKVLRSLDSMFGLDLEAIKAARQWKFRPGTRLGKAVSVFVRIQLDFTLH